MNSILALLTAAQTRYADRVSHRWKNADSDESRSYRDFFLSTGRLALGLRSLGVEEGAHVGFFVNNRYEWIVTDMALQALKAVSVPRGSDTPAKEVAFIYSHAEATFLILEKSSQLSTLQGEFSQELWNNCRGIFIVDDYNQEDIPAALAEKTHTYRDILDAGEAFLRQDPDFLARAAEEISPDRLLTIVYTSGTTGNPKGVMLTHANFIHNVIAGTPRLEIDPAAGETSVVMLPSWHVYERTFEYCGIYSGITLFYSSPKNFARDLANEKPEILITVPRIWESIYQKMLKTFSKMSSFKRNLLFLFIKLNQVYLSSRLYLQGNYVILHRRNPLRKAGSWLGNGLKTLLLYPGHRMAEKLFVPFREKVGGRLRGSSCGAGALPKFLDELFNALGITIVNAYGMTECAPGILSRTFGANTFGTTGSPWEETEIRLIREDGENADVGEKGVLYVRGPQVMNGYYKNPQATAAVLDEQGWLNTGDLAIQSENGEYIIIGRLKDTIVLMGGENVEPEPLEDKIKESLYIDHAVVLGQDQKQLSAIVAVNEEELLNLAAQLKLDVQEVKTEGKHSIEHDEIYDILMKEVRRLVSREHGFKAFERITQILPVKNDFSIGKELTQTLKLRRQYIEKKYRSLLDRLHGDTAKKKNKKKKRK